MHATDVENVFRHAVCSEDKTGKQTDLFVLYEELSEILILILIVWYVLEASKFPGPPMCQQETQVRVSSDTFQNSKQTH